MEKTLSYSEYVQGWTSFFSYIPEMMIGMNSYFYTFKNGNIYRHNSDVVDRNRFYDIPYPSKLTAVFNSDSNVVKNFNTIALNSDDSWYTNVFTDLSTGFIDSSYFEFKEGDYFAYIRSNANTQDLNLRSTQGIGRPIAVNATVPTSVLVTFSFNLGSIISLGADAYTSNGGLPQRIGRIIAKTNTTITIDTTNGSIPLVTDYIFYFQNSIAESYGVRGYYMQFELVNWNINRVELFSVGSSLFKSFP
jgi:hypothetical protein